MDEQQKEPTAAGDEGYSWQGADTADAGVEGDAADSSASDRAKVWLSQLEEMIGNIAEQATPVVKEVGAKAAELAAVAADKAGPLAQKAAGWIDEKGPQAAEKAREIAADLRSSLPGTDDAADTAAGAADDAADAAAGAVDDVADAAEKAAE
jgi:hypothetical protein